MHALLLSLLATLAPVQPDGGIVTVKGHHLLAEVARTEQERSRTLAFRHLFKSERCMFVVPPQEGLHPVKTSKFLMSFDVAWLDGEGCVVEMVPAIPPCKEGKDCLEYGGKVPSRYHIFFQAGTLRRWGIQPGDRLAWDLHFQDGTNLRLGPHVHKGDLQAPRKKRPSASRK